MQKSENKEIDKLHKPKIDSSLLTRENLFKQIYNNANKHSQAYNAKAHKYRNKPKLGKQLEVGQKVLMENHSLALGKSKKLHEIRSGPYTGVTKITNVNCEVELNNDKKVGKVAHRNHLVEYYPAEETLDELTVDYGINSDSLDTFYENIRSSQLKRLNTPVNKFSFKTPTQTEFSPITLLSNTYLFFIKHQLTLMRVSLKETLVLLQIIARLILQHKYLLTELEVQHLVHSDKT